MRFLFLLFLFIALRLNAQNNNPPNWQVIQTGIDYISFSLPEIPDVVDSLRFKYYYLNGDSIISFKVMILKDLPNPSGPVYETIIDAISTKDSVQVIAADSILFQGKVCLDGELISPTPSGVTLIAFFRYCFFDEKLICFFISGPLSLQSDLISKKFQFFNSIHL
ncbi:MAG TPA: hypothetical protein PKY12_03205 [Catalimonadaceae bacterium]|nr:hypothetical protein [Catalimonadaceae bacterium]